MPAAGRYTAVLDTDAAEFGGAGEGVSVVKSEKIPMHGFDQSVSLTLPPLSAQFYKLTRRNPRKK